MGKALHQLQSSYYKLFNSSRGSIQMPVNILQAATTTVCGYRPH